MQAGSRQIWVWLFTGVFFFAGCSQLVQQQRISECGGFEQSVLALNADELAYCDAEVLRWSYESDVDVLTLTNSRVPLNCCGEHSMVVHQDGDVYVVTERDAPEEIGPLPGMTSRCSCMCVFDFEVNVEGIADTAIEIMLVREVTDDEDSVHTVWQGTLDLAQGKGAVVVDQSEVFACGVE